MLSLPSWSSEPISVNTPAPIKQQPVGPVITIQQPGRPDRHLPYREGLSLRLYFREANLLAVAMNLAIYDLKNPTHGRCRTNYIPGEGAVIRIGPPGIGLAGGMQTKSSAKVHDVTEAPLKYGQARKPVDPTGVDQI